MCKCIKFNIPLIQQAQLKNGTEMFEKWVDIPIPIYIKFYFFNVTNADKFLAGVGGDWSTKPEVEELGPYIYRYTYFYKFT